MYCKNSVREAVAKTRHELASDVKIIRVAAIHSLFSGIILGVLGGMLFLVFLFAVYPLLESIGMAGKINLFALLALVYIWGFAAHLYLMKRFVRPKIPRGGFWVFEDFWITSFVVFTVMYTSMASVMLLGAQTILIRFFGG